MAVSHSTYDATKKLQQVEPFSSAAFGGLEGKRSWVKLARRLIAAHHSEKVSGLIAAEAGIDLSKSD